MNESPRHPGLDHGNRIVRPARFRRAGLVAFLAVALLGAIAARPLTLRPPRDPARIEQVLAQGPHTGDCDQCHTTHGASDGFVYPNALVGPDDNALCRRCHTVAWNGGSYATDPLYLGTGHGSSTRMIWPGPNPPGRIEGDAATKCLNCHDPHGWTDALGAIPTLLLQREEGLCLACHDGSPATSDVNTDIRKAYRHPTTDYTGRHTGANESLPTDFANVPLNRRHAECADCHNSHVSRSDGNAILSGIDASKTTLGVSRIAVMNGLAGTRPLYTFVPGSDTLTAPNAEYQLCFKCHSSWTTQPAGQTDLATVLNPANPSYHPVEAQGRDVFLNSQSFVAGWSASSITRCGSCHGSDFGSVRGSHGSTYKSITRRRTEASSAFRLMGSDELCFMCHEYNVYGNRSSTSTVQGYSRFNRPRLSEGHAFHVGERQVPCYACHITHGSTTMPSLLVTGRRPGLNSYTRTTNGGTCAPTCHGSESYTVNYAR